MIVERIKISSFRVRSIKTRAPRSMGRNVGRDMRAAKAVTFTAASDYESALMDGDRNRAELLQHVQTKSWLRKHGAWCAARISRPKHRASS